MFKKIHLIFISTDGPTKIPYKKGPYIKVCCAVMKYENRKAKLVHYLVQLVDLDDPNN